MTGDGLTMSKTLATMFKDPQSRLVQQRLKARRTVSSPLPHSLPVNMYIVVSKNIWPLLLTHLLSFNHCALIITLLNGRRVALDAVGLKL